LEDLEDLAEAKKKIGFLVKLGYKPSFVFVDPRLIEGDDYEEYRRTKEKMKNKYGWDILKSPNDLLGEFIEKDAQEEVKNQWKELADNVLRVFHKRLIKNNIAELEKHTAEIRDRLGKDYWKQLEQRTNDKPGSAIYLSLAEFLFNILQNVFSIVKALYQSVVIT